MQNPQLADYIKKARESGLDDEKIKSSLLQAGWKLEDISHFISSDSEQLLIPQPQILTPAPPAQTVTFSQNNQPKHGNAYFNFSLLITFFTLLIVTLSVSFTVHGFIDIWIPNPKEVTSSTGYIDRLAFLKFYLATLIVSYPIFVYFFLSTTRKMILDTNLRKNLLRKLLIYVTMFVNLLILIVMLTGFVYSLLSGLATLNFVAHSILTLCVSGGLFIYYSLSIRKDKQYNA